MLSGVSALSGHSVWPWSGLIHLCVTDFESVIGDDKPSHIRDCAGAG